MEKWMLYVGCFSIIQNHTVYMRWLRFQMLWLCLMSDPLFNNSYRVIYFIRQYWIKWPRKFNNYNLLILKRAFEPKALGCIIYSYVRWFGVAAQSKWWLFNSLDGELSAKFIRRYFINVKECGKIHTENPLTDEGKHYKRYGTIVVPTHSEA